ncbi:MAG TPA: hypothetical protein VFA30_01945 [Gaiellaceae bacterium]|nr:hypothetical protein [Gaiellaceae bacterium]
MMVDGTAAERARSILDDLIRQRRRLEASGSETSLLAANRLGIVYWRLQLDRALADERRASAA